jgi:uncharacterized protein YndB with AHSA1/START domain
VSPVAAPTEKDAETMPTQKVFKQRVRARMTKTGESYTAARRQLLRKATDHGPGPSPEAPPAAAKPETPETEREPATLAGMSVPPDAPLVADAAMIRATGKGHAEWFAILDAWGATEHTHTEIARWLSETQGAPGWWIQNITVSYERARGMRARHQMANGFSISVTRTMDAGPEAALAAFTDATVRATWLSEPMRQRPTRARNVARFDWDEPPSRVVVSLAPKDDGRTAITVGHEQLPDAEAGERFKHRWREWLGTLKSTLETR